LRTCAYRRLFVTALNAVYAIDYRLDAERAVILRVRHSREQQS
jgi:plasmid stabilization system protein ParE